MGRTIVQDKHTPDNRPGPDPDRLKLDGEWEERVEEALAKPVPPKAPTDGDDAPIGDIAITRSAPPDDT